MRPASPPAAIGKANLNGTVMTTSNDELRPARQTQFGCLDLAHVHASMSVACRSEFVHAPYFGVSFAVSARVGKT